MLHKSKTGLRSHVQSRRIAMCECSHLGALLACRKIVDRLTPAIKQRKVFVSLRRWEQDEGHGGIPSVKQNSMQTSECVRISPTEQTPKNYVRFCKRRHLKYCFDLRCRHYGLSHSKTTKTKTPLCSHILYNSVPQWQKNKPLVQANFVVGLFTGITCALVPV